MERITSRSNPLVAHLRKLLKDRGYRREQGEFICDGFKLLDEAMRWEARIRTVVVSEGQSIDLPEHCRRVEVSESLMASLSPMKSPSGVLFTCAIPAWKPPEELEGRTWLALDGVQDPGNVGTIWRSASAFGADGLFLTGGSADPFGWKAVRSSMGAVFRLPVWERSEEELVQFCRSTGTELWGTALRDDAQDLRTMGEQPCVLAIGSEGRGLSPLLLKECDRTVIIPMEFGCESLNAAMAATVALWERYRGKTD